jgi:ribonuclease Z
MEAFILGCGGMMPLPGRHLTSVLLRREGELFLFDCGEGTQVSLRALNLRWKKINTIFISHTHADHITGLPGILMLSAQVDRTDPLIIVGPPKIKEYIETSRDVLDMYINYDIEVREIENPAIPQVVYEGNGYKVRSFPVKHSKVCVGYTLEEDPRPGIFFPDKAKELNVPVGPFWSNLQRGDEVKLKDGTVIRPEDVMGSERKGRKFSFVTDTMYKDSIIQEVAGSDLFICEGMFEKELEESAREKKHLTAWQAGLLASKAGGIKKMGLIHYSPRYTEKQLKKLRKEARENFDETFLCRDQMVLKIPNVD